MARSNLAFAEPSAIAASFSQPWAESFIQSIPTVTWSANSPARDMRRRPRADAVRFRRLAFNSAASKRWLVFDIDDCDAMDAPHDASLPMPTLAIVNRRDGHGHLAYRLRSPVTFSDRAREAPRRFVADVERDMTLLLGADRAYTGPLAKNPLHRDFRTFATNRDFELRELAAHVDRDAAHALRATCSREIGLGRNCTVFNDLRVYAYRAVINFKRRDDFRGFLHRLAAVADDLRQNPAFMTPLPQTETIGIVRSVARWTWKNFRSIASSASSGHVGSKAVKSVGAITSLSM
ncbi:replication initiation protein [Rhodomicrobium udaipurense]|uniref:Replication initiation protein n=1 Tax=Rhodomicrobium udaipurense TaxID=1202716 RepID=A0A8I1GG76_9HYPH|nr:replication initiation protein [Rhodomicrobium udaipurense]MBJ7544118.1 replication initiation protein [Rhodomicrobium udaipurense]